MPAKKNPKTTKDQKSKKETIKNIEKKSEKKEKSGLQKVINLQKNIKLANEDKMLEKIEKYVDKNREKTSQEIMERKSKRPVVNYQEADLEVMISRISAESKPIEKTKETSKWILYIIYTIIFVVIIIFSVKYFLV
jgi:hypothetical protein